MADNNSACWSWGLFTVLLLRGSRNDYFHFILRGI
uniref:Uncharacterized protein n=1 Tax=Anguilla anguilla TaxID=7936 RepID=A0A0E9U5N8_ANGAN